MHFHLFIAVWGQKYISHMCNVGLRTFLAPNNIPALPNLARSRFVFYVTEADEPALRADPMMQKLAQTIRVEFKRIEPSDYAEPHLALSDAHRQAVREAVEDRAYCIVLNADTIISDGTLAALGRYAAEGKKAVMVTGLRLAEETGAPALRDLLADPRTALDIVKPRALMKFAMQHFHPEVARYEYSSLFFSPHPLVCLWSLGERGFLQRAFHLHPLMIDTTSIHQDALRTLAYDTIDGEFIMRSFGKLSDIAISQDSDEILVFSFSASNDHLDVLRKNVASINLLQRTAYRVNVNTLHRYFFTQAIKLHTEDLDGDWQKLEDETARIAMDASNIKIEPWVFDVEGEQPYQKGASRLELAAHRVLHRSWVSRLNYPRRIWILWSLPFLRFARVTRDRIRIAARLVASNRLHELGHRVIRRVRIWTARFFPN